MSVSAERKVKRVGRACIKCHERKVKCSGDTPCLRCFKENRDCIYIRQQKPRKPRRKKADMLSESSGSLISPQSDMEGTRSGGSSVLGSEPGKPTNSVKRGATDRRLPVDTSSIENQHLDTVNLSQPAFTPFSRRGIKWIISALKLEETEYAMGVVNVFYAAVQTFQKNSIMSSTIWIEPVNSITPLPSKDICISLSSRYFNNSILYSHILNEGTVSNYFEKYFNPTKPINSLGYSEMLIMNMVVIFGITLKIEEPVPESTEAGSNLTISELLDMRQRLLKNSVYLYQRIAVIGDGITGIKALLLMVLYSYMSLCKSPNYMLISTTIRLAQEIGLHRRESYYGLSNETISERLIVWCCCYFIDKSHCLVSGKPPVINDSDVSVLYPEDLIKIGIFYSDQDLSPSDILKVAYLLAKDSSNRKILEQIEKIDVSTSAPAVTHDILFKFTAPISDNLGSLVSYYMTNLANIQAKFYESLLCPGVTSKSFTRPDFDKKISVLNNDLEHWKKRIPEDLRPDCEIKSERFDFKSDPNLYLLLMTLHFSYYALVMSINRLSYLPVLNLVEPSPSDATTKSVELSVSAATRILQISKTIEKRRSHFWNTVAAPSLTAITTLFCYCIKHPSDPGIDKHVVLIAESVRLFFVERQTYYKMEKNFGEWESLHRVFSIFVFLLVDAYKKNFGTSVVSNDEVLNSYIASVSESMREVLKQNARGEIIKAQKNGCQWNLANGFYTLNRASNAVPPNFSCKTISNSIVEPPTLETLYNGNNQVPTEIPNTDAGANLFQNFDFMNYFNTFSDNKDIATSEAGPNYDIPNGASFDENFTNTNVDNMDFEDNSYIQAMFNMPFSFLGEPSASTTYQVYPSEPSNNFDSL